MELAKGIRIRAFQLRLPSFASSFSRLGSLAAQSPPDVFATLEPFRFDSLHQLHLKLGAGEGNSNPRLPAASAVLSLLFQSARTSRCSNVRRTFRNARALRVRFPSSVASITWSCEGNSHPRFQLRLPSFASSFSRLGPLAAQKSAGSFRTLEPFRVRFPSSVASITGAGEGNSHPRLPAASAVLRLLFQSARTSRCSNVRRTFSQRSSPLGSIPFISCIYNLELAKGIEPPTC